MLKRNFFKNDNIQMTTVKTGVVQLISTERMCSTLKKLETTKNCKEIPSAIW